MVCSLRGTKETARGQHQTASAASLWCRGAHRWPAPRDSAHLTAYLHMDYRIDKDLPHIMNKVLGAMRTVSSHGLQLQIRWITPTAAVC